jgi:acyl carrier protein
MAADSQTPTLKIRQIIASHTDPRGEGDSLDLVIPEANLANDLGIDSLARLTIILEIQKELEIDIPDEVSSEWKTVNDFITGTQEFLKQS